MKLVPRLRKSSLSRFPAAVGLCLAALGLGLALVLALPGAASAFTWPWESEAVPLATPSPVPTPPAPAPEIVLRAPTPVPVKVERPLALVMAVFRLPSARLGAPYLWRLKGRGGQPPYRYRLASGTLPKGLALRVNGRLLGKPSRSGSFGFRVRLVDSLGGITRQRYSLFVEGRPTKRRPAPAAPVFSLSRADVQNAQLLEDDSIAVYRLPPKALETLAAIKPTVEAPAPAPIPKALAAPETPAAEVSDYVPVADLPPPNYVPAQGLSVELPPAGTLLPGVGSFDAAAAPSSPTPAPAVLAAEPLSGPAGTVPASASVVPSAASGTASGEAALPVMDAMQAVQIQGILGPLLGLEYPSRQLFEAALDARLRARAVDLVQAAAQKAGMKLTPNQWDDIQAPDWAAEAKDADPAAASKVPPDGKIPLKRLTSVLMPYALRQWIVEQSGARHPLAYAAPVLWDGAGTGMSQDGLDGYGPVYGFYPFWMAQGKVQKPDFGLLSRISLFAFTFDPQGGLSAPVDWKPGITAFLSEANLHRTPVDFTLYRDDWGFLKGCSDADQQTLIQTLAENARTLLDQPLTGLQAEVRAHVPFYPDTQVLGSGITLWLVPPSGVDAGAEGRFVPFYRKLVQGMIAGLLRGNRRYTLNLVVCDPLFFEKGHAFDAATLYQLLKDTQAAPGKAGSGLDLHFIVPLPEPVAVSAETLRTQVVRATAQFKSPNALHLFLRNIVPLLFLADGVSPTAATGADAPDPLKANLARLDSFYGGAYWPCPLKGETLSEDLAATLWSNYAPDNVRRPSAFTCWVAEHRWTFRILFEALILGLLIALPFLWGRRLEELPRWSQLGLLAVLLLLALMGGLLLEGDPRLVRLRQGNSLLWSLIAVLALGALFAILKPRVEEP